MLYFLVGNVNLARRYINLSKIQNTNLEIKQHVRKSSKRRLKLEQNLPHMTLYWLLLPLKSDELYWFMKYGLLLLPSQKCETSNLLLRFFRVLTFPNWLVSSGFWYPWKAAVVEHPWVFDSCEFAANLGIMYLGWITLCLVILMFQCLIRLWLKISRRHYIALSEIRILCEVLWLKYYLMLVTVLLNGKCQ